MPEFRGQNLSNNPNRKQACGSELAKQDIQDAIDDLIAMDLVDKDNIFLLGLSGGGHEIDMQTAAYWILSQYKPAQKTLVTG